MAGDHRWAKKPTWRRKPHWTELLTEVVTSGLCTGCAACVVACPYDVLSYDDLAGKLEVAAVRGISSETLGRAWGDSDGLARRVAEEDCALHVPDLADAPGPDARVRRLTAGLTPLD